MATFTVTTTADVVDGNYSQLSLREAVDLANATTAADKIVFAGALEGQSLVLTGGELLLSRDIAIDGDQNNDGVKVTIDGNGSWEDSTGSRHFSSYGYNVSISLTDLTLFNGFNGSIQVKDASLSIDNCTFTSNFSLNNGGALYIDRNTDVVIQNSSFVENQVNYSKEEP